MGNGESQAPPGSHYPRSTRPRRVNSRNNQRRPISQNEQPYFRLTPEAAASLRQNIAQRRQGNATATNNRIRVSLNGGYGETLLSQLEEAQLRYAMERSRVETQMIPQGAPPIKEDILKDLSESCLELSDIAEGNEQCVICFEEQHAGDLAVILPCGHAFHKKCVFEWLRHHNTCPVCRLELNEHFKNSTNVQSFRKKMEERRLKHQEEINASKRKLQGFDEVKKDSNSGANVVEEAPKNGEVFLEAVRGLEPVSWKVRHLKCFLESFGEDFANIKEKSDLVKLVNKVVDKANLVKRSRNNLEVIAQFLMIPFDNQCSDEILAEAIAVAGEKLCKGR